VQTEARTVQLQEVAVPVGDVTVAGSGEFYFDGEPVELDSPREASELGIATVYQDLALCDDLDALARRQRQRAGRR
jgi:D-xylose transport system ATP-binding protein